jgi:hypothetical protein
VHQDDARACSVRAPLLVVQTQTTELDEPAHQRT